MNHSLPRFGTALLLALLPLLGRAQSGALPQEFLASTVVLTSGDTLRGSLLLRLDMDLLLVTMADNTVRTVHALAVRTFAVRGEVMRFDRLPAQYGAGSPLTPHRQRRGWYDVQRSRPFLVYPWNHDREYSPATAPAFFERLNGGPVILLRRQQLVQRAMPWSDPYFATGYSMRPSGGAMYYTDVREMLYLGTPEGNVLALRKPKRDLLAYFPAEAAEIEQYARQNNLSFTDSYQLAKLVDYANSLRQTQASVQ
jgi:hypothetical protein